MSNPKSSIFSSAQNHAERAFKFEENGDFVSAYNSYVRAAELIFEGLKYNNNQFLVAELKRKGLEYLERAEKLEKTKDIDKRYPERLRSTNRLRNEILDKPQSEIDNLDSERLSIRQRMHDLIIKEKPNTHWDEIGGLDFAKNIIKEAIVLPIKRPDLFLGSRKPWKGILLYGPPGTGKTLLAKAAASECGATFFVADAANLTSKWLGESEKSIKELFADAREYAPSIIFFDEIDSIATHRSSGSEGGGERRIKTQLLNELQGFYDLSEEGKEVVFIGATNRPWDLDSAVLRRFERKIYVNLPEEDARMQIFLLHTQQVNLADNIDFEALSKITKGYSGSDIRNVCREALMQPIREIGFETLVTDPTMEIPPVQQDHFIQSLDEIRPETTDQMLARFENWAKKHDLIANNRIRETNSKDGLKSEGKSLDLEPFDLSDKETMDLLKRSIEEIGNYFVKKGKDSSAK